MPASWLGTARFHLGEIDSSSDELWRRAAEGAPHGTVVTAAAQLRGRGRQGRSWASVEGNLMVSWLLRFPAPPDQAGALSIVQGLALCEFLDGLAPGRARLKWPNDLLLDGRKVGGLLLEARSGQDFCVVSGLGLNLVDPPGGWGALEDRAVSLAAAGITIDKDAALEGALTALEPGIEHFTRSGPAEAFASWPRWSWLDGKPVEWEDTGQRVRGTALGLASDGGLRVQLEDRTELVLRAGDVHLREGR